MTRSRHRVRYRIEVGAALISAVLALLSVLWKDWIEIVLPVDPDQGSGALEYGLVIGFAVVAVVLSLLARREHRLQLQPA
jgi:hypothetical protein